MNAKNLLNKPFLLLFRLARWDFWRGVKGEAKGKISIMEKAQ
jgi:hypothetical protein